MVVISFVSQKGGVGKTSTAINLAVEAQAYGLSVVILDLDPQVSAFGWKDIRGDADPVVAAPPVPHLPRTLKAAEAEGVQLVIIDTAGRTNDAAEAAARAADLVIIPLQPSLIDLKTLDATLSTVRLAGGTPVRAVLSRVKAGGSRHDEALTWLGSKGVEVAPVTLGERVAYQDAYAAGQGVSEAEPGGKAAQEIEKLYLYAAGIVGLPTSKGASK